MEKKIVLIFSGLLAYCLTESLTIYIPISLSLICNLQVEIGFPAKVLDNMLRDWIYISSFSKYLWWLWEMEYNYVNGKHSNEASMGMYFQI